MDLKRCKGEIKFKRVQKHFRAFSMIIGLKKNNFVKSQYCYLGNS